MEWIHNIKSHLFLTDYRKKDKMACTSARDTPYTYMSEARQACTNSPACSMFFDTNGRGEMFRFCNEGAEPTDSDSILYIKGKCVRCCYLWLTI